MIFIVTVVIVLFGISLMYKNIDTKTNAIGFVLAFFGSMFLLMMIFIIGFNIKTASEIKTNDMNEYLYLSSAVDTQGVYKIELNTKIVKGVNEWNESLAWLKAKQRDLWIGILIPNIYDDYEFINFP